MVAELRLTTSEKRPTLLKKELTEIDDTKVIELIIRITVQRGDISVPQIARHVVEEVQTIPEESISERIAGRDIVWPVPRIEVSFNINTRETTQVVSHERVPDHTVEQTSDIPSTQAQQGRITDHIAEQTVNVPSTQAQEQAVAVTGVITQEHVSGRIMRQMADVPVSQVVEQIIEAPRMSGQDRSLQRTVDVPVVTQDQVLISQILQKIVGIPQVQYADRIVDVPVTAQRRVPTIQTAHRTVEVPQV